MDGIEHLREARGILHGETGELRERLRLAAHEFWSAVFHIDSWPIEMRSRAEALTARIFRYGVIDEAVRQMGDETATKISQELLRFCDNAERQGDREPEWAVSQRDGRGSGPADAGSD